MDELNRYTEKNSTWSKWAVLNLAGGRINNLTQETIVGLHRALPKPVKKENSFLFWCKDVEHANQFDLEADTSVTGLYAVWLKYIVMFDFNNGTVMNMSFGFNTSIEYPKNMKQGGYTFNGWDITPSLMPAKNIIIIASWIETVASKSVEVVFSTK